jgi:hypothetical protein
VRRRVTSVNNEKNENNNDPRDDEPEVKEPPEERGLAPLAGPEKGGSQESSSGSPDLPGKRREEAKDKAQVFEEIDPWPERVDGHALLHDLTMAIRKYVVCSYASQVAIALWVIFTYTFETAYIAPMLLITSPEKGCGKSNLMTVLRWLVSRPMLASNFTGAVIYRIIEHYSPTLLIDEADTFLRRNTNPELVGILNSGHTQSGAFVWRTASQTYTPQRFTTWSPKAIAGIGSMPETIEHRSISIRLRRALRSESVTNLREYRVQQEFESLRRKCLRWANDHMHQVRDSDPEMPSGLDFRPEDNWRPLVAIADLCGNDWGAVAREAALTLSGGIKDATKSIRVELLEDIREILKQWGDRDIPSEELTKALVALEDRPWGEFDQGRPLSTAKLAKMLRYYSKPDTTPLAPVAFWHHGRTLRGYHLHDFDDAFARYLSEPQGPQGSEVDDNETPSE